MKNTTRLIGIIALLALGGYFLFMNSKSSGVENSIISSGEVQVVKMYTQGMSYVFEPSSVKKGTPVRIEADIARMPGCAKSVISQGLGIRKTFSTLDRTVTFTPQEEGQFYIACSMNMYRGDLIVE